MLGCRVGRAGSGCALVLALVLVGGAGGRDVRVAEIQRSRLLAAAVRAVDELGWANTTVADIVARSRISRRTFYETFANREECLAAVFEDLLGVIAGELAGAGLGDLEWRERVRRGLGAILALFDREPVLARVCVVQALSGGPRCWSAARRSSGGWWRWLMRAAGARVQRGAPR